jgi:hypothetical protein
MTEETKGEEKNDTFLESVANELNKNCEFREVETNEDVAYGYMFPKWIKWTPNKLSYDYPLNGYRCFNTYRLWM